MFCCLNLCSLFSFRHHLQLGGHLHPSHQQRLEPHPVHLDHQLFQRAGGGLTLSLAKKTHVEKRPQKPHVLHNIHGNDTAPLLPATTLPPAGVTDWCRSPLRLREAGTFLALCTLLVESLLLAGYIFRLLHDSGTTLMRLALHWKKNNNH